jgi:two-component system nitrogen regulation response regulator NtrX
VLLDLWMPGIDGIQTLQRLKAMQTNLCIIVMSGHGNIETAVKATRLGAFDYLENRCRWIMCWLSQCRL